MQLTEYGYGMDLGVGLDTLSGRQRGDGVVRTPAEEVTGAEGQTVSFFLDRIETLEQLETALGVSAEASVGFGIGGGSAKLDFVRNCSFNSFSLFMLARVAVMNSFRQMRDVRLTESAAALVASGEGERFRERFGDSFVRGLLTGGEFFAVLEIETSSEGEKEDVSGQVEGGYGTFSAEVEFSSSVAALASHSSVKVSSFQRGGDTTQAETASAIAKKALEFGPDVAGDRGVPYAVTLMDYRSLDMPAEPNWVDLQNAKDVIRATLRLRASVLTVLNDIDYILTHRNQFEPHDTEQLNATRNRLAAAFNGLTDAASRCADDVSQCRLPEALDLTSVELPIRKGGTRRPTIPVPATDGRERSDLRLVTSGPAELLAGLRPSVLQGRDTTNFRRLVRGGNR